MGKQIVRTLYVLGLLAVAAAPSTARLQSEGCARDAESVCE